MKKIKTLILLTCFAITLSNYIPALAASSPLNTTSTKTFLFAVPEGGWSSLKIEMSYYEYFSTKGSNNTFSKRVRSYLGQRNYATSVPIMSIDLVSHSNGTSFSSWKSQDVIYDSSWDFGGMEENTDSVSYSTNTSVTATLSYSTYCQGAIPPTQTSSVTLSLKTK